MGTIYFLPNYTHQPCHCAEGSLHLLMDKRVMTVQEVNIECNVSCPRVVLPSAWLHEKRKCFLHEPAHNRSVDYHEEPSHDFCTEALLLSFEAYV